VTARSGLGPRLEAYLQTHLDNPPDAVEILSDEPALEYFSHDIAGPGERPIAVVLRPRTVKGLVHAIRAAHEEGLAIYPRGGGLSYTAGYTSGTAQGAALDLSAMSSVSTIDEANRCVTVQAGCTWEHLHRRLADTRWRTPFAGPLSGYESTVGGALSNDAAFFGSAQHGSSRNGVLGLTAVLADGTVLSTGTHHARPHPHPAGPDLTPLFLGDGGALAVKAEVTLALVPRGGTSRFASFAFSDVQSMLAAQDALIDHPLLMECFGFDRDAHRNLARGGLTALESAEMLKDIARSESRLPRRLARLLSAAAHGRRLVTDLECSLHLAFEGADEPSCDAALASAITLATALGGTALPDTIPRITHTRPFRPIKALLGPSGERWLPVHGVFRPSDTANGWAAIEAFRALNGDRMAAANITTSALTVTAGRALLLEVHFFWPDALGPFLRRRVRPEQLRDHGGAPDNPQTRAVVHELRRELADALTRAGATHFQVGRFYTVEHPPPAARLLSAIKQAVDPNARLNPGLGTVP